MALRVSVIIPAYNSERYLPEAVESAAASDWPEKEIIVFDDGSTDRTREIAAQMERDYAGVVRALWHTDGRNHGVAQTRNRAAQQATGEALAFLDADDRFLPNHLRQSLTALSNNPGAAFTYGRARYLRELERDDLWIDGEEGGWGPGRGVVPDAFERLLYGNFVQMSTIVCRKDCFVKVGGFEEGLRFQQEDHLLWTKLAYHFPIFYLGELCAEYRIHAASYSANLDWERIASAKQLEYLAHVSRWVPRADAEGRRILRAAWQKLGNRIMYRLYCAARKKDFAQARREVAALRRVQGKARLMAAPLDWYRVRLEARRKPSFGENEIV